ncbi:riboflavin aldehyde-forming enzyme [Moesziomyces antarcticus]|uniref:Riboflavin aldehyde-forming enzyme n=2 Tax=Pseudozyma antarctica TaxID=84753 RepID=A0A081CKB5_PSEA2|nr:riboflavin aldehyde-forming enzyme [Moesziomyces antarcticus]GAK67111.1 riboflavin aldehyde-forming enzyme [Moesziomyces antarcticus]SPO48363.1 uncharacterized protein PSANT_06052 [Moesziomyces antarcticus]
MTFTSLKRAVVLGAVAAGLLVLSSGVTVQVAALPTYKMHRAHVVHARNLARSQHDQLEDQVHALEAALQHYVQYGDQQSLEIYLHGLDGNKNQGEQWKPQQQNEKPQQQNEKPKEQPQQPKEQPKDQSQWPKPQQQAQQQQQQQQAVQQPQQPAQPQDQQQDDCDEGAPAPEQPSVTHHEEHHSSDDSSDHSQTHSEHSEHSEHHSEHHSSSDDASTGAIDGYTPPSFSTSSSPSVKSLYTSAPFTGHATFYDTGMGACGIVNADNDPIVAVSRDVFEQYNPASGNPNHNSLCGRRIEITWNGKTTHAFAMDECPGCEPTSLDLSPALFAKLDDKDKGVLPNIQWRFI